jgi:hypothetical protein
MTDGRFARFVLVEVFTNGHPHQAKIGGGQKKSMAVWQSEWRALSERIEALRSAGEMIIQAGGKATDVKTPSNFLSKDATETFRRVTEFRTTYRSGLPKLATVAIDRILSRGEQFQLGNENINTMLVRLALLSSFRAEMNHALSDVASIMLRRIKLAFVHLQRTIMVDDSIRDKWGAAYDTGEPECERLGAVHLLSHSIWAFKVNVEGERTDLVLQSPMRGEAEIAQAADVLALTEWKKIVTDSEAYRKAEEAVHQALRYSEGALGGVELHGYCHIVTVSQAPIDVRSDWTSQGRNFRHINIAVARVPPSKSARRRKSDAGTQ